MSLAPRVARRWLWLRPRALFEHSQLGPLLAELTRDTGERALLHEAERAGVELRVVDRALLVDRGETSLALAAGPFDARRILDLHWDRMLPPRHRGRAALGRERVDGALAGHAVALATDAECGLLARSEGDPHLVDAVLDRPARAMTDPGELIRWHLEGAPAELDAPADAALTTTLRWCELRADPVADGLAVTLVLAGPLPANTPTRMTRLLGALATSEVGSAVGADAWLHPTDDAWRREGEQWQASYVVPWRGLRALVALARGAVDGPGHGAPMAKNFDATRSAW